MKKKRMIMKILKRNDLYENFEKRGGSREKGGGGNEIHAPCAYGTGKTVQFFFILFILAVLIFLLHILGTF